MTSTRINQARVKSVSSGDTLVLASLNDPSKEMVLSLAFVSAPRLRRDGDEVGLSYLCMSSNLSRLRYFNARPQSHTI